MAKRKNNIDDIDIVDDFELEDIDDFDPFSMNLSMSVSGFKIPACWSWRAALSNVCFPSERPGIKFNSSRRCELNSRAPEIRLFSI